MYEAKSLADLRTTEERRSYFSKKLEHLFLGASFDGLGNIMNVVSSPCLQHLEFP